MRTFRSANTQDASDLPWVYEIPPIPSGIPVWGVNLGPSPVYASFDSEGTPVGEPLYYEWSALLDPADTPLPGWITEVVEPPISEPPSSSPGILDKLKSAIGF